MRDGREIPGVTPHHRDAPPPIIRKCLARRGTKTGLIALAFYFSALATGCVRPAPDLHALYANVARDTDRTPVVEHGKYLIILQAGKESHEGLARALHALLYSKELKEHGHEVVLVFDGAGTEWAEEWTNPASQHKLAPMYRELSKQGLTNIICDFCAGAFATKESLQGRKAPLIAEYEGHPSIAKWADKGYQIVIL